MNNNPISISVIIPCYNSQEWVSYAVSSIVENYSSEVEVIVVNDGSTDESLDVLAKFGNRITIIDINNGGACRARNIGLNYAKKDFVIFLDADDYLEKSYLSELWSSVNIDTDLVVGRHSIETEGYSNKLETRQWKNILNIEDLLKEYLQNFLQTAGFLWKREFVIANGGWNESVLIAQDTDFMFRMIKGMPKFSIAGGKASIVWREVAGSERITTKMNERKRQSMLDVFVRGKSLVSLFSNKSIRLALAERFYGIARFAYASNDNIVAKEALAHARELGLKGHPGSNGHKIIATILGLKLKTNLVAWKFRHFSRIPLNKRPHPYNISK